MAEHRPSGSLCVTDDAETTRRKIAATATYLDIWLMRRTVNYIRVGYSNTSYAMYNLCKDIRRKPLTELVDVLAQKLETDDVSFDGSPTKGRTGIDGLGLNQFSRRYIYHLLARLTAFTEVGAGKPDLFDKYVDRNTKNPCDIEHIWANDFSRYARNSPPLRISTNAGITWPGCFSSLPTSIAAIRTSPSRRKPLITPSRTFMPRA